MKDTISHLLGILFALGCLFLLITQCSYDGPSSGTGYYDDYSDDVWFRDP